MFVVSTLRCIRPVQFLHYNWPAAREQLMGLRPGVFVAKEVFLWPYEACKPLTGWTWWRSMRNDTSGCAAQNSVCLTRMLGTGSQWSSALLFCWKCCWHLPSYHGIHFRKMHQEECQTSVSGHLMKVQLFQSANCLFSFSLYSKYPVFLCVLSQLFILPLGGSCCQSFPQPFNLFQHPLLKFHVLPVWVGSFFLSSYLILF